MSIAIGRLLILFISTGCQSYPLPDSRLCHGSDSKRGFPFFIIIIFNLGVR